MRRTGKRGIQTQMARTMAVVALVSLLLLSVAAASGLFRMRTRTLEINRSMGDQAAQDSRELLEKEAMEQLTALAVATAGAVDANIQSITSQVDILTASAQALYADPASFQPLPVNPPDAANQGKFVAQIVYAQRTGPASVAEEVGLIGNLAHQMNGVSRYLQGAGTTQIGTESGFIIMCDENSGLKTSLGNLDPVERGWYRMAADQGKTTWSEVFEDSYGRGLAVTCGKPVYGPQGELRAVISIGSTLDDIGAAVTDLAIGESGYAFVVDQAGQIIMSRDLRVDAAGHVCGVRSLTEDGDPAIRRVAEDILQGRRGMAQAVFDGAPVYLAYEPMEHMPWSVVTVIRVDEVLAPAMESEARISALSAQAGTEISGIIRSTGLVFLLAIGAAVVCAVALGHVMAKRLTQPISHLTQQVEQISGGGLHTHIDLQTDNELQTLAEAFNSMTARLDNYIRDLTAVTAEKERIGAELSVATHIQSSMLPCIFPAFPDREEFDIYATMDPAKEVGGDFYDFFMVDRRHLAIVVADVSGKGVPAALFMVIGKTLIKDHTQPGADLGTVFTQVNDLLCESNSEGLFITAFEGVLDLVTGEFLFVNAGHEIPFLARDGQPFAPHKIRAGFVLAGMENIRYKYGSLQLSPGDKLFQYTDGVTEATNAGKELYGMERLERVLQSNGEKPPEELLPAVKADIDALVGEAPQFDDITMLCLEYRARMKEDA